MAFLRNTSVRSIDDRNPKREWFGANEHSDQRRQFAFQCARNDAMVAFEETYNARHRCLPTQRLSGYGHQVAKFKGPCPRTLSNGRNPLLYIHGYEVLPYGNVIHKRTKAALVWRVIPHGPDTIKKHHGVVLVDVPRAFQRVEHGPTCIG